MSRRPQYGHHKASGQARTSVNGKRVYIGEYGSAESRERFDQIIAEWEANRAASDTVTQTQVCIDRLAYLFLKAAQTEYVDAQGIPTGETDNFKYALRNLRASFSGCRCIDFGPKKLKSLQQTLAASGLSRSTVNGRVRRIKQVFKWGVSEELVPPRVYEALCSVRGLKAGATPAPDPVAVRTVDRAIVEATLPHLSRPLRAMVVMMIETGCRPSEARLALWSEIDQSDPVWRLTPAKHKTAHKLHKRVIHIGPKCQTALNSIREHSRSDYVFDPQTAVDEQVRRQHGPNAGRRLTGLHYTKDSLRTAIARACEKAGVPRWTPKQLRKTVATEVRKRGSLELAQQVLGHSSKQTTERYYAAIDLSEAESNALQFG